LTPFSPIKPSFHSAKEAIFVFVNHLAQSPIQDLLDTRRFLTLQKEFLDCYPQYNHIVYYHCIELFLKNQKLSREDYESVFPEIPLVDRFNTNGSYIHVSGISNALVISNLIKYHSYFKNKIILYDTPMRRYPGDQLMNFLNLDFPEQIKTNLLQTGQPTPDLSITFASGIREFDIKQTVSIPYIGNKLVPVENEIFYQNFDRKYLPEIKSHLKNTIDHLPKTELIAQKDILNKIGQIHRDSTLSPIEKNNKIHSLFLTSESFSIENRPSILFPTTNKIIAPSVPENILNNIPANAQTAGNETGLRQGLKAALIFHGPKAMQRVKEHFPTLLDDQPQ
jgi:hypothetical protein